MISKRIHLNIESVPSRLRGSEVKESSSREMKLRNNQLNQLCVYVCVCVCVCAFVCVCVSLANIHSPVNSAASVCVNYLFVQIMQRRSAKRRVT